METCMATSLSTSEMKARVRKHFEDFVNNQRPEVIRDNMRDMPPEILGNSTYLRTWVRT